MARELIEKHRPSRNQEFVKWVTERVQAVEEEVDSLRAEFVDGGDVSRAKLLEPLHSADRLKDYEPGDTTLSGADARLLVANRRGYAFWEKYESYLHLIPPVATTIEAIVAGDLTALS